MASELLDDGHDWWVLIELLILIVVVHIVAHAEELLSIIGAGEQDASHSDHIVLGNARHIRAVSLKQES